MTLLTKGMGVVKKILTKNRKDKLLDSIRTRRTRNLPKSLQNKKVKIEGKEYKSEQHTMDVDTYSSVSSSPDKKIKAWLKHKGFKE